MQLPSPPAPRPKGKHVEPSVLHIPRQVIAGIQFPISETITHERKLILRSIPNLKVLTTYLLNHLLEQQATSRKRRGNPAIHPILLIPTPTPARPGQRLHDLIAIAHKLLHGILLDLDGLDVLA